MLFRSELDGLGRKMPWTFGIFTLAALALMGVPGLAGFISKWYLAAAAVDFGSPLALAGIGALLISALLTAIYLLSIVIRAFFTPPDFDETAIADVRDPNWYMLLPLGLFALTILFLGLHSAKLMAFLTKAVEGIC